MKIFKIIPVLILTYMLCSCTPQPLRSDRPSSYPIGFTTKGKKPSDDNKGQRAPGRPIYGYISQSEGIQINIDKNQITAYEIWDAENETLIATFVDEMDFVDYLFTSCDCYKLRLVTDHYYYLGEIDTTY